MNESAAEQQKAEAILRDLGEIKERLGGLLSPTIQFIVPVEEGNPYEATLTQGFAPSRLCPGSCE